MQLKRRWYQFSLRTLVVVMLLVSVVLGYWGNAWRRAQRQWEAVRAIEEAGGGVRINTGVLADPYDYEALMYKTPKWHKWLGIDCPEVLEITIALPNGDGKEIMPHLRQLREVKSIRLEGDWLDDEGMAVVAQLPELRILTWKSANSTVDGLVHLRNHPRLTEIHLFETTVADVEFEHLSTCANLEELEIEGPNTLTSKGIHALSRLKLKSLSFRRSPLAADAIEAISDLTTLESLDMEGPLSVEFLSYLAPLVSMQDLTCFDCKLTGDGLKKLAPLKQLVNLNLDMAGLCDEDMELLASFSHLHDIDLSNSTVTNVGLMKLAGMKELLAVNVFGTNVTAEGVKEFERLAPNVHVFGKPTK